jgi:hypothetical protein
LVSLIVVILGTFAAPLGAALTVYVSPDGKDSWSGRIERPNAQGTDGPVATLERARDVVRQMRATAGQDKPKVVVANGR